MVCIIDRLPNTNSQDNTLAQGIDRFIVLSKEITKQ
jgi:hypothetical protein